MEVKWLLLAIIPILFSVDLIWSFTNEELVVRDVVKFNETKCPDCYASQWNIPVCGSDGRTYQNPGTLTCAFKCNQQLKFVSYGPCPEDDPTEDHLN